MKTKKKRTTKKRKINYLKLFYRVSDILLIIGVAGIIYTQGKLNQLHHDQEIIDDYVERYERIRDEYTEYRANSYQLLHY